MRENHVSVSDPALMPVGLAALVRSRLPWLTGGPFPAPRPRLGQSRDSWLREVALARDRHDACALRASSDAPPQAAPAA